MKGERTDLMTVYIPSNHFESRIKERLHIDITPELNQEITVRVQNGLFKGRKKSKKTAGVYIYELYTGGNLRTLLNNSCGDTLEVVIDEKNGQLLTVYGDY
jgi:hypothetical protein